MAGIHRQRPGADAMGPATGEPAVDLGDGIWMSPGLSNSYLLTSSEGPIVVNTGMGFEGRLHRRAFDAEVQATIKPDDSRSREVPSLSPCPSTRSRGYFKTMRDREPTPGRFWRGAPNFFKWTLATE